MTEEEYAEYLRDEADVYEGNDGERCMDANVMFFEEGAEGTGEDLRQSKRM